MRPSAALPSGRGHRSTCGWGRGPTAADFLGGAPEAELARVFAEFGDERRARALAREIVRRRTTGSFRTSDDFVNAIRATLGPRTGAPEFARLFQAVRIAVNDELDGLATALPAFRDALVPGGALAVISYHSGEDRLVKHLFRDWERDCSCPPRQPVCTCDTRAFGRSEPRKPILPDAAELAANPRSRSAKLRIFRVSDVA
jgi:16S rRNA (cytosine1402-N4)-methyltransferase